jgi:hypothetical protein
MTVSPTVRPARCGQLRRAALPGVAPSLLSRVVELPNAVFAIHANRPRLGEAV